MAKLTKEDFNGSDEIELSVKLSDPHFQAEEKDGDKCRMALVVRGTTENGIFIDHYIRFSNTIFASGKNKGRKAFDVSAEQCCELGMPKPFNPSEISMLDGVQAVFVCGLEEYNGVFKPKVKFVNVGRKPALPMNEAANIWAQLSGEPIKAQPATGKVQTKTETAADADDFPF